MDDLITWLRAQLDDDEQTAIAGKGILGVENPWWTWQNLKERFPTMTRGDAQHIERHGPYRVLAEVAAKRRIIDEMAATLDQSAKYDTDMGIGLAETTLTLLALPYADRPGYREEWRP